jgi:hypothetical protein
MGLLGTLKSAVTTAVTPKPLVGTSFEEGAKWIGVKLIGQAAEKDTAEYYMLNTNLPKVEKNYIYCGTLEVNKNSVVVKLNGKAIGTLPNQFAKDAAKVIKKQGGSARCAIKAASAGAKTQTLWVRK